MDGPLRPLVFSVLSYKMGTPFLKLLSVVCQLLLLLLLLLRRRSSSSSSSSSRRRRRKRMSSRSRTRRRSMSRSRSTSRRRSSSSCSALCLPRPQTLSSHFISRSICFHAAVPFVIMFFSIWFSILWPTSPSPI